jgi:hypothetical protein
LKKKLATVLIIPSSWGSQLGGYPAHIKDLSVDSGSIIVKGNIEEFFNHVSMPHLIILDFHISAPSSKALKKSTLGR